MDFIDFYFPSEDLPLTYSLGADQSMQIWLVSLKLIQRGICVIRTAVCADYASLKATEIHSELKKRRESLTMQKPFD